MPDAIEMMTYALLEQSHAGWENNDGGHAEFTFDVAERSIALDYDEHYVASTNYQHEF